MRGTGGQQSSCSTLLVHVGAHFVGLFTREWNITPRLKAQHVQFFFFIKKTTTKKCGWLLVKQEPVITWNSQSIDKADTPLLISLIPRNNGVQKSAVGSLCIIESLFGCCIMSVLYSNTHTLYFPHQKCFKWEKWGNNPLVPDPKNLSLNCHLG